jgi:salicylate biosynthesis isochorismate synthase
VTLTLERVAPVPALGSAVDEALSLARSSGDVVLLSIAEPLTRSVDPLAFLGRASHTLGGGILWSQPGGGSFAGAGAALELGGSGPERFRAVSAAVADLRGRVVNTGVSAPFPLLGGFAFADASERTGLWRGFADARLVVPGVLLQKLPGSSVVRITVPVSPTSSPLALFDEIEKRLFLALSWAEADGTTDWDSATDSAKEFAGRIVGLRARPDPCRSEAFGSGTRGRRAHPPAVDHRVTQSVPDRTAWESSVANAIALIQRGTIEKVVLAREERITSPDAFSAIDTLRRLRAADASATLYAMQSDATWFVGATPERLVRLSGGRVDVTCLAGSIGIGDSERERLALAARLLASEKDRHEHEIVVDSTMAALREVCDMVQREAGTPRVVVARSVQHLETPVTAYLSAEGQVLDLVARLHPTPAVGGFPRERALAVIRDLESIDRGWYAGPFGWTDLDGSGEFSVAIRSALLQGRTASVFAGCGIVANSEPASEFAETCLKMRPMLAALGAA